MPSSQFVKLAGLDASGNHPPKSPSIYAPPTSSTTSGPSPPAVLLPEPAAMITLPIDEFRAMQANMLRLTHLYDTHSDEIRQLKEESAHAKESLEQVNGDLVAHLNLLQELVLGEKPVEVEVPQTVGDELREAQSTVEKLQLRTALAVAETQLATILDLDPPTAYSWRVEVGSGIKLRGSDRSRMWISPEIVNRRRADNARQFLEPYAKVYSAVATLLADNAAMELLTMQENSIRKMGNKVAHEIVPVRRILDIIESPNTVLNSQEVMGMQGVLRFSESMSKVISIGI